MSIDPPPDSLSPYLTAEQSTIDHLQTLPIFLQTLNPHLAALHIARLRSFLPSSSSSKSDTEGDGLLVFGGWCKTCGHLRDGYVGSKSKKRKGGARAGDGKEGDGLKGKGKAIKGKSKECELCGTVFTRKIVRPSLPPARRVMRTRKSLPTAPPDLSITSSTSTSQPQSKTPSESNSNLLPTPKPPPTPLQSPKLKYIPTEDPNPPTYPPPPNGVSSSRTGSGYTKTPGSRTTPAGGGVGGAAAGGKKRKKSGLAKLLAQNRERVESSSGVGGGSWGLG